MSQKTHYESGSWKVAEFSGDAYWDITIFFGMRILVELRFGTRRRHDPLWSIGIDNTQELRKSQVREFANMLIALKPSVDAALEAMTAFVKEQECALAGVDMEK